MRSERDLRNLTGLLVNHAWCRTWWMLLALPYAVLAIWVVVLAKAPIARALGITTEGDAALILDVAVLVILPAALALRYAVARINRAWRSRRQRFIAGQAGHELVMQRHNPNLIYRVVGRDDAGGRITVVPVWNVDGPVAEGAEYSVDLGAFVPLGRG